MGDLISRQAAIDLFRKRLIESANNNVGFTCDAGQVFEDASERIKYWIKELPSVERERWIPVTERLPNRNKDVLVTLLSGLMEFITVITVAFCVEERKIEEKRKKWLNNGGRKGIKNDCGNTK